MMIFERESSNSRGSRRFNKTTAAKETSGEIVRILLRKIRLVIPIGLEPITSRLGILRSILMSYGTRCFDTKYN